MTFVLAGFFSRMSNALAMAPPARCVPKVLRKRIASAASSFWNSLRRQHAEPLQACPGALTHLSGAPTGSPQAQHVPSSKAVDEAQQCASRNLRPFPLKQVDERGRESSRAMLRAGCVADIHAHAAQHMGTSGITGDAPGAHVARAEVHAVAGAERKAADVAVAVQHVLVPLGAALCVEAQPGLPHSFCRSVAPNNAPHTSLFGAGRCAQRPLHWQKRAMQQPHTLCATRTSCHDHARLHRRTTFCARKL